MDTTKDTAPPANALRKLTRELRGLALYRERGHEIEHTGHGVYTVPACDGGSYRVDLDISGAAEESCSCPDHQRHPEKTCKHLARLRP